MHRGTAIEFEGHLADGLRRQIAAQAEIRREVIREIRSLQPGRTSPPTADPLLSSLCYVLARQGTTHWMATARAVESLDLARLGCVIHAGDVSAATSRSGRPAENPNSPAILAGDLLMAHATRVAREAGLDAVRSQTAAVERFCIEQLHRSDDTASRGGDGELEARSCRIFYPTIIPLAALQASVDPPQGQREVRAVTRAAHRVLRVVGTSLAPASAAFLPRE